ncbi:MAG: hypothetical protein F4044_05515 [Rhodobacteraceae bacterium]|nr:hypothetical protein [Paracoccaceae bacterium]
MSVFLLSIATMIISLVRSNLLDFTCERKVKTTVPLLVAGIDQLEEQAGTSGNDRKKVDLVDDQ